MKRRSSAGGKPAKPRGPKRSTPKRRNAPKTTRDRGVSVAGQETVVARLTHERDEALLRETANSEILRLISKSPGDLELVFRTILENATRICNANFGTLFRFDGENFYPAAQFNTPAALLEATERRGSFKPTPGSGVSLYHVMRTKQVFHRADMAAEPVLAFSTKFGGARSQITVPMLKDDALIGAIVIYRQEVRPFTDKQIALVENFAAQAVIAIENARLLNELRESLGQQTATADVLKVISSSPGELDPVFNAMLENATRLCEAKFGVLYLFENGKFCPVALVGASPEWQTYVKERGAFVPTPDQPMGQMKETRRVVQAFADTEGTASIAAFRFGGARVFIAVPMLKDGELVGAIAIFRQEARPFAEKQIELVTTFADQAVIAIENARLLNELRQRTADLSESLEQQTATSEVLNVINSSPGEVESVFQATLENATRLCEAKFGVIFYYREGAFHPAAELNTPTAYSEFIRQRGSFPPASGSTFEHLVRTKQVINIVDAAAQGPFSSNAAAKFGGARSQISVPMLKEDELIGAIAIYRQHVLPFTDKQIELVKNFAAQAVIAIENARLLNELRGSLERQTATSEVLGVISKSAGDLEPVYQAILENAARICEAQFGILTLHENGALRMGAMHNVPTAFAEWLQEQRGAFKPIEGSQPDRVLRTKQISYTADAAAVANPGRAARLGGARSTVCVPMLKDEELVGTITIYRQEVRPFTDKQIELLQNFAAQAVIAIENAETWHRLGHDIGFGIGIAHGFATLGTIGFEGRFDYAAIGTVSNVASRLCDEAKPGQILINSRVLTKVENAVTVEPVGEFTLKGIRRPMTAYNVLAPSPSKPN